MISNIICILKSFSRTFLQEEVAEATEAESSGLFGCIQFGTCQGGGVNWARMVERSSDGPRLSQLQKFLTEMTAFPSLQLKFMEVLRGDWI